ncbi:MAG: NAD-dependent epimerase/dehydratase family protein [Candidatus Omnitrophica bacterium]|nr:NAD-dependent epimerase/dehydratase family protein [Candidatus Omnitrophota bacterium]
MKIIITGGAGMIGSHCAEHFAKKKHEVVVIDNLLRSSIFGSKEKSVEYNWQYLKNIPKIKLLKKDVRDREDMARTFRQERPDLVIHTAGQPGVKHSLEYPFEDYEINSTGTINVLEALRKANKKGMFIYTSTNKVYGNNVNQIPIKSLAKSYAFKSIKGVNERFSIDLTGHTPYGVSKLAGDLYAQDYAQIYNLKSAIFRMSCIYGTRQFGFEDQGWLAWFAIRFFLGKPVTIYGDGKQVRDILWVDDLIKAFEAFMSRDFRYKGEVFNMGGGEKYTISLLELIAALEKISGKKIKIQFGSWRKFDQKVYVSDITKAGRLLNWRPTISVQEGIQRLYHWVSQNAALFKR